MADTRPAALGEVLRRARERLRAAGIGTADLEARLLVQELAGVTQQDMIARPDLAIEEARLEVLARALARRERDEPVHRILGWREFYGLRLRLSAATLEPRPDTEVVVDALRPYVEERVKADGRCTMLDLGTGTGAIALALLASCPGSVATATDISDEALATAALNAHLLGLGPRFTPIRADWFTGVEGRFHLIVSNPPYIPTDDVPLLAASVRDFDPHVALDGGPDGLEPYRIIARSARGHLPEGGLVVVEFGFDQSDAVIGIFDANGFGLDRLVSDLAGHRRAAIFH